MTLPQHSLALAGAAPEEVMAHHAKTFHWANRLMPSSYRRDFAILYAFCRLADDVVDEAPDEASSTRAVAALQAGLESPDAVGAVAAFAELAARRGIPLDIARELLEGVASDIGGVRVASVSELLRYAYRVASTVGLMVCHILDVRDPQALAYAIDLGIAMQLTNISRDVCEDRRQDRVYLPGEWIDAATVHSAVNGDVQARTCTWPAVLETLNLAEQYYRSADHGMRYLPVWARWGILTASRCYEAIGDAVRGTGPAYWDQRCYTTRFRKVRSTAGAILSLAVRPRYWRGRSGPRHDAALHVRLAGLPAVECGAAVSRLNLCVSRDCG